MDPIGRETELALLGERLRDRRLVTVVGAGGIGKTTLARTAATRHESDFGEGSRFVDLTRVGSAAGVRESVATQLGYTSFRALIDAPGDHSVLMVIDNCEHVVEAVAEVIDALLEACQMPTVLATSRVALELPGEAVLPLGPLGLPRAGTTESPAVALFLERAAEAGVELDASDDVVELCRRLDGVPLAIELAAARVRSMTPKEVLERLSEDLGVLDRPRRRRAARHQSLRSAIDWSHELLSPAEQSLFDRLSVIPGPFTADFAHAVAGAGGSVADTQDRLDALVAASMVVADPTGDRTTYRVLETLRAYGRERTDADGVTDEVEARFVDHVVDRITDIIARGATGWSADALRDLLAVYDSAAAAVRWCLVNDRDPQRASLLVAALWGVVHQAHTEEIGTLAEAVLEGWPDTDDPWRADAAATAATCRYMLGDDEGAVALALASLEAAERSPFAPATLRRAIAQSRRATGDAAGALEWFAAAGEAARRLGLVAMAIEAESARAQVLADLGQLDEARACIEAAAAEAEAAGSEVATAWAHAVEGSILLRVDPAAAARALEAAGRESRRIGYDAGTSAVLRCLALAALLQDDLQTAAARTTELLDELMSRGSTYELRLVFDLASSVLQRAGRRRVAADLAATALHLPVVSITASVGHELFPLDPAGGTVLSTREGILTTRAELDLLLAGEGPPDAEHGSVDARIGVFRRAGELWEVGFAGDVVTVKASKGMEDLARLLAAPGREVHSLELAGGAVVEGSTGEVLDATARRAYEERVRDLQAEIDEADANHDVARADQSRAELDALVDQLTEALGLGGRSRTKGSSAERARSTVTQRVRSTIRRLDEVHPRLGRHLRAAIRTGSFCAYEPEEPTRWQL